VAWSADRRVKLGIEGRTAVLRVIGQEWPNADPPLCPRPLCRDARKAIGVLLATVVSPETYQRPDVASSFDPDYSRGEALGKSLADDVCGDTSGRLVGAASTPSHWARAADVVTIEPGPPTLLELLHDPSARCAREIDVAVARWMEGRRLTIVGGIRSTEIETKLTTQFEMNRDQIRWIEAEKDSEPEVDRLKGAKAEVEIVLCITGAIGHAGSTKTLKIARSRGVRVACLEAISRIPDALRDLFGEC